MGKLSQKWQQKVLKREFSLSNFDDWKFLVASRKMGYKLTSKRRIGVAVFFAHYMGFQVAAFT
jgi:hypothetical protein